MRLWSGRYMRLGSFCHGAVFVAAGTTEAQPAAQAVRAAAWAAAVLLAADASSCFVEPAVSGPAKSLEAQTSALRTEA